MFIVDDGAGGTNRKTTASRLKTYIGGGITNAQQWRITTSYFRNADPITANWEEVDTDGYGRLGTTMASAVWNIYFSIDRILANYFYYDTY